MVKKKGFLLLELIAALFLLMASVPLCMQHSAQIQTLAGRSLELYKKLGVIQNSLERARALTDDFLDSQIIDDYTIETVATRDSQIKNFLHIEVTVYDKGEKVETWFSGVALPYER